MIIIILAKNIKNKAPVYGPTTVLLSINTHQLFIHGSVRGLTRGGQTTGDEMGVVNSISTTSMRAVC